MKKIAAGACNILKFIKWGMLIGFSCVFLLIALFSIQLMFGDVELFENKDRYTYFGDGRFYVMSIMDSKSLFDYESGQFGIMFDIDRYLVDRDYVYIEGYYSTSSNHISYYDLGSDEFLYYESLDEVPRYTVLNYETGEAEFHLTLDDIPEEDREFFTKDLGWWCKLKHTCYEKE